MSKLKHTPGTWDIFPEECDRPYIRIRGTIPGGRFKVANVLTPVYEDVHPREAEETRANARLIASAPEMLEALIGFCKSSCGDAFCPVFGCGGCSIRQAKEAVEKATGMKIEEVLR